jgi:hypothetical protein
MGNLACQISYKIRTPLLTKYAYIVKNDYLKGHFFV